MPPDGPDPGRPRSEEEWRDWRRRAWERRRRRFPVFAVFVMVAGVAWLGNTLRWWDVRFDWDYVGPVLLILFGISALSRWTMRQRW